MTGSDEVGAGWRGLVDAWGTRKGWRTHEDGAAVSLESEIPGSTRTLTLRFTTARNLLVAFATDGRVLKHDELATAAAAANAWNTEQLVPMLAVWDVRGPSPCLAGVCSLPLNCHMDVGEFAQVADEWLKQARQMFLRCQQVFQL
ncbi:hypothetical protein AB0M28_06320 [Streptomyces sp. NPDC051940]|uniref:hypothetical protein n=1 Tax=Streptomyces sp. NPDC051940 TaxID=3155675 RepID=UPI00342180E6